MDDQACYVPAEARDGQNIAFEVTIEVTRLSHSLECLIVQKESSCYK